MRDEIKKIVEQYLDGAISFTELLIVLTSFEMERERNRADDPNNLIGDPQ